ncbi:MAG: GuaB1 family IMP dehydrogenase-related protein [Myxococcales bacterium]|nr:GuaB1 family IMP dehydrogenase-related protein [Myxococcales bacterium]
MRFLHPEHDSALELSLDDVFIVPAYFAGGSRLEVDLAPVDGLGGSHPIVSANMNAVTGKRMAETMARLGGLGVLPQDMELRTVERIVRHVKSAPTRHDTALVVSPRATLRDVVGILRKRSHDMVLVADDDGRLLGLITSVDLRDQDQYTPAERIMSRTPVSVSPETTNRAAFLLMDRNRVKAVPVVDADGRVLGVLTRDDAVRGELLRPALDAAGKLMVAAALGISARAREQAQALCAAGVDVLVLDTAHGHQRQMLEAVAEVRAAVGAAVPLVAGNVCTAEGTRDLLTAGADIAKVNVGPGAMCTTRMQTGAGRPTFSAVLACAEAARALGKHVWADGGVRYPRDVALYLAAGAARVMIGTLLAGTHESPGDIKQAPDGRLYKESWGMASSRAVGERTAELDAFDRAKKGFFREGISTSRIYLEPGREGVGDLVTEIITGLQSTFSYVGAANATELYQKVVVGVQSPGGYHEGKPRPGG